MAVVTDDAGQRDGAEVFPLGFGEDAVLLPPEPSGDRQSCFSTGIVRVGTVTRLDPPVSVPQSSELPGQQAGQKLADSPAGQSGFRDGPHPHVDVVGRPVQELEGVGQSEVV